MSAIMFLRVKGNHKFDSRITFNPKVDSIVESRQLHLITESGFDCRITTTPLNISIVEYGRLVVLHKKITTPIKVHKNIRQSNLQLNIAVNRPQSERKIRL